MFPKIIILSVFFALCAAVPSNLTRSISLKAADAYTVSPNVASFVQAWGYCIRDNKNFASLLTVTENDYLAQSLYGYTTNNYWVGGIYLQHGSLQKWYWVSKKEDISYHNWKSIIPSIPSNSPTNYCLLYNYNAASKSGSWTAENCSNNHYFICEKV